MKSSSSPTVRYNSRLVRMIRICTLTFLLVRRETGTATIRADLARAVLSDAREQIRDTLASSARLLEADITAMLMSFDQAIAAAIRHIDSAVSMRDEKSEDITYLDNEESLEQRIEADHQLAFVTSIIVESVVNSAMKPKAWLEDQMHSRAGQSPFHHLQARDRAGMGSTKKRP